MAKVVLLDYGDESELWSDGNRIGTYFEQLEEADPTLFNESMQYASNDRWYELYKAGEFGCPHPSKVFNALSKVDPRMRFDWVPEFNVVCIYVDSPDIMKYIENNFSHMIFGHDEQKAS
jgi:hypothetical protein